MVACRSSAYLEAHGKLVIQVYYRAEFEMFSDFTSFLTIFFHNTSIVRTGSGRLESCSVNPSTHVLGSGVLNKGSNQFFYKVVSHALGCFM